MKLKNVFLGTIAATIAFASCDQVSTPVIPQASNSTLPTSTPAFINSSDTSGANKYNQYKMLLEVCGGHLCTNCPLGQSDAEAVLSSPIGGQVIFMQDEEGYESSTKAANIPPSAPPGSFQVNYQCAADSIWFYAFGSPNQFPFGMMNREGYSSNAINPNVIYFNYQDSCNTIIGRPGNANPTVTIDIHDSCWTNPRIIGVEFQVAFKKSLPAGSYSLETLILEDNIVDWQDSDDVFKPYYVHRNILRGAFGNNTGGLAFGTSIPSTTMGTTWTTFQTYDFVKGENGKAVGWNMAHCYIVAFVFNATTYEVVQAEMIKVE